MCDSLSIVNVVDTGSMIINGQSLRYLDLAMTGAPLYAISGRAVERIGMISGLDANYLFPLERTCDTTVITEYFFWDFICYEDDNFALYNPASHTCDYYESIANIDELKLAEKSVVKIFDLSGREAEFKPNSMLICLYDDGTTERVFIED